MNTQNFREQQILVPQKQFIGSRHDTYSPLLVYFKASNNHCQTLLPFHPLFLNLH